MPKMQQLDLPTTTRQPAASPRRYSFASKSADRRTSGVIGTPIHGGYLTDLDDNPETRDAHWYGTPTSEGIAHRMLKDAHAKRSVEMIADPLVHADWHFQPVSDAPEDLRIAATLDWAYIDRLPWDELIRAIILSYGAYGFALREYTDDVCDVPERFGGGSGIYPTGLHERPAWTVERWLMLPSDPAKLRAVEQWVGGNDVEPGGTATIDAGRLLRWSYDQEGSDFAGRAPLRAAYGPWKLKNAFQAYEAIRHERLGVGTPVVTGAENANDKDLEAVETILAYLRTNQQGYLVLPHGYEFKWQGAGSDDVGTNIRAAIEACNLDIAWNVSASFMALSILGKTGSHALGDVQQGQYHIFCESHAKFYGSIFNRGSDLLAPVERTVRLNFGERAAVPKLIAKNLPTRPWLDIVDRVVKLAQVGAVTPDDKLEDDIRAGLRLPPRDPASSRGLPQATGGQSSETEGE